MQRVAIGRALVREPAVYLMDEPLSSLDAKLREDLRVELKRIQRELGATILYVTHDQVEAMTLADRVGVLSDGRLVQIGTPPRDLRAARDTVYVAQRLGTPTINLLPPAALGAGDAAPAAVATIGLRPEDVHLGRGKRQGRVLQIEHLGAETVVRLELETMELQALAPQGRHLAKGDFVPLEFARGDLLLFDARGRRLAGEEARYVA